MQLFSRKEKYSLAAETAVILLARQTIAHLSAGVGRARHTLGVGRHRHIDLLGTGTASGRLFVRLADL